MSERKWSVWKWREIAEWDWVQIGRGDRLHAVASTVNDCDEDWFGEGLTVCGREGRMVIPGVLSRLGSQRCPRCCATTGLPRGAGSPKNTEELRPVAEARIEALRAS